MSDALAKPSGKDWKSTLRHVGIPLLAGAGVAALQTAQTGVFDYHEMKGAAVVALISGIIRFIQRFVVTIPEDNVR